MKCMDVKITLRFNEEVIHKAKAFAEANNISLSRLTEFLYNKITSGHYRQLEDLPVAEWVSKVAEGEVTYQRKQRSRNAMKKEFLKSRR